jgi:hypothetical protein
MWEPGTLGVWQTRPWVSTALWLAVVLGCLAVLVGFRPAALAPGAVTDLRIAAVTDTSAVLAWTEVRSSTTAIPRYVVRYGNAASFTWSASQDLLATGCAAPIVGSNTSGGRPHACILTGLLPGRAYAFQMVAYTGVLNSTAVFGPLSNIATVTTDGPRTTLGPLTIIGPPIPVDTSYVEAVAVSTYPGIFNGRYPIRGSFNLGTYTLTAFVGDSITARGYLLVVKP